MVLGLAVIWNSPLGYLAILPLIAVAYLSIVRAEETFLEAAFGEAYRSSLQTGESIRPGSPWLRPDVEAFLVRLAQRVVHKEYGTTFSLVTTTLALFGVEKVERLGFDAAAPALAAIGVAWLIALTLWMAARRFKKRSRAAARRA